MEAGKRPKLVAVTEETQRLSLLLGQELTCWPGVSSRPMFGLTAYYRGASIFACLPAKRAMEKATAVAYKLPQETHKKEMEKWQFFELESEKAISQALQLLRKAYEAYPEKLKLKPKK